MRIPILLAALALAGTAFAPAALAQTAPVILPTVPVPNPAAQPQYGEILAQQELARQQAIAQQNQLMSLEGQIRTQQAVQGLPGLTLPDRIVAPYVVAGAPAPSMDAGQLASIPDSKLAESNRRVLEASKPPE